MPTYERTQKLSTRIFSRSKYDICLNNVGSRCTGIFKLQMVGSLFPPQTRSKMMESWSPRTGILDQFQGCLERVPDTQQAVALIVSDRPNSLTLLPELLPLIRYGTDITWVFGMGIGVSHPWIRKDSWSLWEQRYSSYCVPLFLWHSLSCAEYRRLSCPNCCTIGLILLTLFVNPIFVLIACLASERNMLKWCLSMRDYQQCQIWGWTGIHLQKYVWDLFNTQKSREKHVCSKDGT